MCKGPAATLSFWVRSQSLRRTFEQLNNISDDVLPS